ncbi:MAG: hypothetical protein R3D56_05000 [Paracoccaceae bacterium]
MVDPGLQIGTSTTSGSFSLNLARPVAGDQPLRHLVDGANKVDPDDLTPRAFRRFHAGRNWGDRDGHGPCERLDRRAVPVGQSQLDGTGDPAGAGGQSGCHLGLAGAIFGFANGSLAAGNQTPQQWPCPDRLYIPAAFRLLTYGFLLIAGLGGLGLVRRGGAPAAAEYPQPAR